MLGRGPLEEVCEWLLLLVSLNILTAHLPQNKANSPVLFPGFTSNDLVEKPWNRERAHLRAPHRTDNQGLPTNLKKRNCCICNPTSPRYNQGKARSPVFSAMSELTAGTLQHSRTAPMSEERHWLRMALTSMDIFSCVFIKCLCLFPEGKKITFWKPHRTFFWAKVCL